jgi:gliding motility-associated-like protein
VSDVCNDSTLVAVNNSTVLSGTLSYVWRWGDGNTSTNLPAVHRYGSSGTYAVSVTVTTDKGCADSTVRTATVILGGNVNFTATEVCETYSTAFANTTVLKTGTNVQNYLWHFGDGNTATGPNASHTYAAPGNYMAKLVLDYGNNCFDSIAKPVTVHQKPTASFTATTVCENNPTQFTNLSSPTGLNFVWNFGDGQTSTEEAPLHLYSNDGTYSVQLIATSAYQCTDSLTMQVSVLPVGDATFSVAPVCKGDTSLFINQTNIALYPVSSFIWDFGDSTSSTASNPKKKYNSVGTYQVRLIANFANGCADTAFGFTSVNEIPSFDAQVKHVSCFGFRDGEIVLNAQTGNAPFTFNWSPALSNSAVQQNVASGKYEVTFTDVNNCSSKLSIYISQPDSLSLFVAIDSITCFGKSDGRLRAFVTGGTLPYEYRWSNGITVFENTGIPQGNYSVSVTDANGCRLIREIVLPNPARFSVNLKEEDTIQLGESITLFPSYNYSKISHWHWSPATALNCIDCESPTANPYNDIVYTVYAATEKGCIDSASTKIYVEHQPVVYVPNVFTPNNDDVNDVAMVYANHVLHLDFFIFNRWGEKVYEGHDIHQGWDGYYKNKLQDPETYVYVVTVTFLNNKKVTKTGSITLVK